MHYFQEENIVTYVDFDSGITFYLEAATKVDKFNRERKNISRSCENSQCITSNDQHNCSIDEEFTFNNLLNPYILRDVDPAALKPLNHTNDGYSLSN